MESNSNTMTSDPWNIAENESTLLSPNGLCAIRYENLREWRMNAPLGGECYVDTYQKKDDKAPDKTYKIAELAGYPSKWQVDGQKFAIPLWIKIENNDAEQSQTIFQRLGVVDMDEKVLTIYKQEFRVLHIKAFVGSIVEGVDSPIHDSKNFVFDIGKEEVVSVVSLDKVKQS